MKRAVLQVLALLAILLAVFLMVMGGLALQMLTGMQWVLLPAFLFAFLVGLELASLLLSPFGMEVASPSRLVRMSAALRTRRQQAGH
jgi:hypothetical protein